MVCWSTAEPLAVAVEVRLINELGWAITEAEVLDRSVGRSDAFTLGEIERAIGRPVPDWQSRYERELHQEFHDSLSAVPGIEAALDELTTATCVASSGTHEKIRLTLGLTTLFDRFDGRIYSATEVAAGKPAPDLFLHAASQSGVAPDRCLVVEDSRSGVQAARAAGMRSLGFAGGLTPPDWLEGPETTVFDAMADLPRLVATV